MTHLAEKRKRLGLTQKQVAEFMDVSPGRVSQIENGDVRCRRLLVERRRRFSILRGCLHSVMPSSMP